MARFANELRDQVIEPTLIHLGANSPAAVNLLLTLALLSNHFRQDDDRLGLYCISPSQHRHIWDDYLAFQPDLASEVRSLASQRWFLENPDRELITNTAYASAIAWMIFSMSGLALPASDDVDAQMQIWRRLFGQHIAEGASSEKARDYVAGRLRDNGILPPAVANLK